MARSQLSWGVLGLRAIRRRPFFPRRILSGLLLCALILSSGSLVAGARVVSGQWEHTMTTDGEPGSDKVTDCMTPEEAASINGDSQGGRAFFEKKAHGACKLKVFELKGSTMSYVVNCGARSVENTVTFHGETSEGVTVSKGPEGTQTMHVNSRRLGACR
jgi:hypothetical protein